MENTRKEKPVLKENQKHTWEYLKEQVDYSIASCVRSRKNKLDQAYDIRNGQMPMEEYQYLKDANGVEMPSDVRHIPVLKSMFDVLQGDEALQPIPWHITCNDSASIESIMKERHGKFLEEIDRMISNSINNMVKEINAAKKDLSPIIGKSNQTDFSKKQEDYKQYKTFLEIYSQKVLNNEIPANEMKFRFNIMFNDLMCSGAEYYQSKVLGEGIAPLFREINPKGLYYTKPHNTIFIKDCPRVVYVEEISVQEIYMKWGHKFTEDERKDFFKHYKGVTTEEAKLVASMDGNVESNITSYAVKNLTSELEKVYYVEWKENTEITSDIDTEVIIGSVKKRVKESMTKYQLDRYEGVRIGEKIYVDMGKSKYVIRSSRKPWDVPLTFNGACYNDRNGEPFSLVMATKNLAMKIDIMHYFLENLVAVSGTKVIPVSFPDIPVWIDPGSEVNRVKKWLGYIKQGAMIVDYSQDGAGKFNNYSAYDLSISNSVSTIEKIIIFLEETASKIIGVPRARLGQMLQKDGKGVTENAIEQSTVVTQPILQVHNTVVKMALTDHLNHCRMAYKSGYPGLFALGRYGTEIFSKGHDQFCLADFEVHVDDSSKTIDAIAEVKELSKELAVAMGADASFLFDLIGNKSLTHVKELAKNAFESGKENKIQELTQQLEEANGQLQQYYAELNRLNQSDADIKAKEFELKSKEIESKIKVEESTRIDNKEFNREKLKNDDKRIQLEHLEMAYKPNAREVKDN